MILCILLGDCWCCVGFIGFTVVCCGFRVVTGYCFGFAGGGCCWLYYFRGLSFVCGGLVNSVVHIR